MAFSVERHAHFTGLPGSPHATLNGPFGVLFQ
jgi:hypothetical protein